MVKLHIVSDPTGVLAQKTHIESILFWISQEECGMRGLFHANGLTLFICTFVHRLSCPARMRGTYELAAFYKSNDMRCLHGLEHRLSEPEVFAAQPRGRKSMYLRHGQRVYMA